MNLEKRSHILATARQLFADRGFEGASIRDIAEQAKVNIAAVSYYFGSKQKLLEALLEQGAQLSGTTTDAIVKNNSLSYPEKINLLIEQQVERALTNQHFFKLILSEQIVNKNPGIISIVQTLRQNQVHAYNTVIREGQEAGVFPQKEVDVPLLFNTIIGALTYSILDLDSHPDHPFGEEQVTQLRNKLATHFKNIFRCALTNTE